MSNTAVESRSEVPVAGVPTSYGQILKSSALIGGSQALNIAIGIVRTKAMAMLLGPSGSGFFGLYGSISDLTQSIAGMGINTSGVRQIAEAENSDNRERVAQTIAALRSTSLLLGLLGTIFLVVFCRPVSIVSFGNDRYASAISLLSVTVFLKLVSAGQGALLQGLRRISDLAQMSVWGAVLGTAISIPLVYVFRERGIVPSLIAVACMSFITSWWFSRRVQISIPRMTARHVRREVRPLITLGLAFMATGLLTLGSAYIVRIIVFRNLGIEATGIYQSAWSLGGLYVSFLLQAMGADFYPRLTAVATDNEKCIRLVNEQARIGLLIAGPGAVATLTLAPLVISLFYSTRFSAAVPLLRWFCLGAALQVITWPMGFITVAKGRSNIFFWSDFAWTVVYIALAWTLVRRFGLIGTGIAFFASYVFHFLTTYLIVRSLCAFQWSRENTKAGLFLFSLIGVTFCGFYVAPVPWAVFIGMLAASVSGLYSAKRLLMLIPLDRIPALLLHFRSPGTTV